MVQPEHSLSEGDLVSVIVPAHNAEAFIRRTLTSALAQSHRALEVVVVDDGSTDGTAEVVRAVAEADPRLRLIRTENRGVAEARNLAIARSRGDFVAPLDADDLWHPEKVARQLALMHASAPEVGVVYCWSAGIDENDRVVLPTWNDSTASGDVLREIVVSGIAGNGSTPLIRRTAVDAVGGYDQALAPSEDWHFYTALAGVCAFAVVPEHLVGYRLLDTSASLDVRRMERAVARGTTWIAETWPSLPNDIFRDRSHVVEAYLASLAIREREFPLALRYLWRAFRARPGKLFAYSYFRLFFMFAAHAVGLRTYRWLPWRRPPLFLEPSTQSLQDRQALR